MMSHCSHETVWYFVAEVSKQPNLSTIIIFSMNSLPILQATEKLHFEKKNHAQSDTVRDFVFGFLCGSHVIWITSSITNLTNAATVSNVDVRLITQWNRT